jgi:hypothetical protein
VTWSEQDLDRARTVADAVLYEGYLLYPYRSTSSKNQARWQFGVLAPPGAPAAAIGEESGMAADFVLRPGPAAAVTVHLRCLQLQARSVQRARPDGSFAPVAELDVAGTTWLSWDEAVTQEAAYGPFAVGDLHRGASVAVELAGGEVTETLCDASGVVVGRVVRRRETLVGQLRLLAHADGALVRVSVGVENATSSAADKDEALRRSLIGAHLMLAAHDAEFISVIDPPEDAKGTVSRCSQRRCWPVLAGVTGQTTLALGLPIILYDYPEVAPQSAGPLFDSTEIDEILTLRVMTLTEEEKSQARATDPQAAAIIDRCEQMTPQELQSLHGILRDPHAGTSMLTGDDWWAAEAAAEVSPERDAVIIQGTRVAKGSLVRLHPSRRADAQDLFIAGQTARVSAVHLDLDGQTHVAVSLVDDPAAELHDWYGRHLYFAPEELEPLPTTGDLDQREENPS